MTFTNAAGTWFTNTYDSIGQLKIANSSVNSEDRGYKYDAAWNLNYRTNNGAVKSFTVNSKNELTAVGTAPYDYDANGNLTSIREDLPFYEYDDENRLVVIEHDGDGWRTEFTYDGTGRLRQRLEYTGSRRGSWTLESETRYVYDGMRVIQERDGTNAPTVSYTRGTDLSGSLEGAGGIGGLLGRSHGYASTNGNWYAHNFYHADGNGNITYLVNSSQTPAASYRYDPFGNTTTSSGTLAAANVYRFSSKEIHVKSVLYYYGYRWYDPNAQRWPNRDPIGERGGINLYGYVINDPVNGVDPDGHHMWKGTLCVSKKCDKKKCKDGAKNLPENGWEDDVKKGKDPWREVPNPGECQPSDMVATPKGQLKIPGAVTCTIECDKDGNPEKISCQKDWKWADDPILNPGPEHGFPKNPYEAK